jgi:hypothetical protein
MFPVDNSRQAAELARVPEEKRAEVWAETVERTEGKPTAAAIRDTAASKISGPTGVANGTPPADPDETPARRDSDPNDSRGPAVVPAGEPDQVEEVAPTAGGREAGVASSSSLASVDTASGERESAEHDRRRRHTNHFATGIAALWSLLDPDPVAFAERTWLADCNPHRETHGARNAFTADGLRLLAKRLDRLADHAAENGGSL